MQNGTQILSALQLDGVIGPFYGGKTSSMARSPAANRYFGSFCCGLFVEGRLSHSGDCSTRRNQNNLKASRFDGSPTDSGILLLARAPRSHVARSKSARLCRLA